MLSSILDIIDRSGDELVRLQTTLVAIPALGPTNGGQGEAAKAEWLSGYLSAFEGVTVERIDAPDDRVESGVRPSLAVRRPGRSPRTLWLIAHTDVVPTGDLSLWQSDPFVLRREGDLIYGRGVEDNHQGMVGALLLLRALEQAGAATELSLGILLAADEETGNALGIEYILRERPDVFAKDDLVLIPDFGTKDGAAIEVAEKSVLWLKFTVLGRQCHASTPDEGVNSLVGASALILALGRLNDVFGRTDTLFDPPTSTFAPTKKEANVPNVNTIPGQDIFYLDCRVLPDYLLDDVEQEIRRICDTVEAEHDVRIAFERVVREQAAPGTPADCEAVTRLAKALRDERGIEPRVIGIGGGTVAAAFRKRGLPAACWSTLLNTAHQPNEHSSIANTIADARVFARLLLDSGE
ncbi:M20 family metallo-hydrolase [Desulfomicrobium salsuginis]